MAEILQHDIIHLLDDFYRTITSGRVNVTSTGNGAIMALEYPDTYLLRNKIDYLRNVLNSDQLPLPLTRQEKITNITYNILEEKVTELQNEINKLKELLLVKNTNSEPEPPQSLW
jgi:predicted translin family RNA/ssDNA-binding protein